MPPVLGAPKLFAIVLSEKLESVYVLAPAVPAAMNNAATAAASGTSQDLKGRVTSSTVTRLTRSRQTALENYPVNRIEPARSAGHTTPVAKRRAEETPP